MAAPLVRFSLVEKIDISRALGVGLSEAAKVWDTKQRRLFYRTIAFARENNNSLPVDYYLDGDNISQVGRFRVKVRGIDSKSGYGLCATYLQREIRAVFFDKYYWDVDM